jgi:hypothetical protein
MFIPVAVISTDGTFILIKCIESIQPVEDGSIDSTIDKLRNDTRLFIRTVSGKEYTISMLDQRKIREDTPTEEFEIRDCIIKRWADYGNIS